MIFSVKMEKNYAKNLFSLKNRKMAAKTERACLSGVRKVELAESSAQPRPPVCDATEKISTNHGSVHSVSYSAAKV